MLTLVHVHRSGERAVSPLLGRNVRDRIDVSLFLRRLLGTNGSFQLARLLPRGRVCLPKEYVAHGIVLAIVGAVVSANMLSTSADRGSLLFALFREAEVEEGPVSKHAAQAGNARASFLGLIPVAAAGGVSEGDIEFELANTLGGNALVAAAPPETAEASSASRSGVAAYTIREGDTVASIAARFGISANTVLWANGIRDDDVIRSGDILVIPPGTGVLHKVVAGDDVTSLAQTYDAKVADVIARNGLDSSGAIRIGQRIFIPDGQIREAPRRLAYHAEEPAAEQPAPALPAPAPSQGTGFQWPTSSRSLSQYFGWRHTGIDNTGSHGSGVFAVQSGQVAFSGWLGGYGRLVILDHGKGLRTYYAHLSSSLVKQGESVERGSAVGRVGCTGRCTGPHVHFEVRVGGLPVNPLRYF